MNAAGDSFSSVNLRQISFLSVPFFFMHTVALEFRRVPGLTVVNWASDE